MEGMQITNLDEYLEKVNNFTIDDFVNEQVSFFKVFSKDEETKKILLSTNNKLKDNFTLACYHLLTNKEKLSELESEYIDHYFKDYLLKETNLTDNELAIKALFMEKRLTKEFKYNDVKDSLDKGLQVVAAIDKNIDEYFLTITGLVQESVNREIKLELTDSKKAKYNLKSNTLFVPKDLLKLNFINFSRSGCDYKTTLDFIYKLVNEVNHAIKEDIKRNSISMDALIYSLESALNKKNHKPTNINKETKKLIKDTISNNMIDIDSAFATYLDLIKLMNVLELVKKDEKGEAKRDQILDEYKEAYKAMKHFIKDGTYFDTNNLENDAFEKLFNFEFNALRATPKSNLTNTIKLFATGGKLNPIMVLKDKLEELKFKINKEKDETKKLALIKKYEASSKLVNEVVNKINSYKIEKDVMDLAKLDYDDVDKFTDSLGLLVDACEDDYLSFVACKQRFTNLYNSLGNAASSNSPSKVKVILEKRKTIKNYLEILDEVQEQLDLRVEENSKGYKSDSPLEIISIKDVDSTIVALQNFTGKGIEECQEIVNHLLETKKIDVTSNSIGFNKFYKKILELCGVEFSDTKKASKSK